MGRVEVNSINFIEIMNAPEDILFEIMKNFECIKVKRSRKSIHTLLTPKRNPNGVILNRDRNASKNILVIMKEFLQTQTRKTEFSRTSKTNSQFIEVAVN